MQKTKFHKNRKSYLEIIFYTGHTKLNVVIMVFFGKKEKLEDQRLLASMDAMNGAIIHQIENGKISIIAGQNIAIRHLANNL